jgi:restriction system protein
MRRKSPKAPTGTSATAPEFPAQFLEREQELAQLHKFFSNEDQQVIAIQAPPGAGKTTLISAFAAEAEQKFPGGIYFAKGYSVESPAQFASRVFPRRLRRRALLIIDDADLIPIEWQAEIDAVSRSQPKLDVLVALRSGAVPHYAPTAILPLKLLMWDDFQRIIGEHLSKADRAAADKLWDIFGGSPLVATLAGEFLRSNNVPLNEFVDALRPFKHSGILGPDGKPISSDSGRSKQIILEVTEVNARLLDAIKNDPSIFYTLGARKFEEIVAELLTQKGYRVSLTPASKDGGFDMYAARKDALGEFLFLVECKKYAPNHKVGVQLVRALHGVVQNERATAGVIATTSFFTRGAKEFQEDVAHQMKLADYVELQKWLGQAR